MAAPAPTPCGRQMATAPAGGTAGGITHDSQTEGYYIVSGDGTMFTDGKGHHLVSSMTAAAQAQYQLGFLGFGGHTGTAGTKPFRFGIPTFSRLLSSRTSFSWMMPFR